MKENTSRKPAILGGDPIFEETVPFNWPTLPPRTTLNGPLDNIFSTGQLTNGKYVKEFENKCASYLGSKHAIAVSSCTSGLVLAVQVMGLEGEVLLPSFTFCATGHSLLWNNLKPVFVDCKLDTHNIDTALVEQAIGPDTSAILAVDVFGNPCDRDALRKIARKHNLKLIVDCAHSFGSLYEGKQLGGLADIQVFSLSPTKVIVAGEGGIAITDSDKLAEMLRMARNYGDPGDYNCRFAGLNARMPEINAALGAKSLEMVEENVRLRNDIVDIYKDCLEGLPGTAFQKINDNCRSTYKDFSILINEKDFGLSRDTLARALIAENIETKPYFNPPLHKQDVYLHLKPANRRTLPNTEYLSSCALSLPLFAHMSRATVEKISAVVRKIYDYRGEIG